ncbi:MAG: glycoside hydrolase family 2 protein [Armatimonadetes bacterium]|nr:glycoside hydrolase family 2 protein [Armatimonadota bacterium]
MKSTHLSQGWEFRESGADAPANWLPAQVPGHVHLDLWREGVIPDPFERMHELGLRWVDETGWEYRTTFEWRADPKLPSRVLKLHGLDTVCEVRLNEARIGAFDNMHRSFEIDVSSILREGRNELVVRFLSARKEGARRKEAYFATHGISADAACFYDRSFVRKGQYMFGWDWGPKLISCGIWKPVELLEYSSRIERLELFTEKTGEMWSLRVRAQTPGSTQVRYRLSDPSGNCLHEWHGDSEVAISDPKLWYPHDLGAQPLYRLTATLGRHTVEREFGLRTVELVRENDEHGQSFQFVVNGLPVWARGANWIPDHSFPSIVSRQRVFEQLRRAKGMGMNMLRVWGGGLYESEDFYDAADELGILVWQDFAFGCAYYPDTDGYADEVRREALENVQRLRHRVSLALWCGNNENLTMWESGWGGKDKRPPRYFGEKLYEEVIPEVLRQEDPGRPYIPTSPWGGEPCNSGGTGDQHYWDVWHGRGDWRYYQDSSARFSSEFGFVSSPSIEVWKSCLGSSSTGVRRGGDWDPYSPAVQWHDKTGKGYENYLGMVHLHYPEIASMDDLVYYTQLNQRDAIRFAFEHYRGGDLCKGALVWQLNDCWPVQSWAILDCTGSKKVLGHEMARLCAPRMIALQLEEGKAGAVLANDGAEQWNTTCVLRAVSLTDGSVLREASLEVNVEGFARRAAGEIDLSGLDPNTCLLWVEAEDAAPAWRLLCEPKDIVAPLGEIEVRADGDRWILASKTPVVDLWIDAEGGEIEPNGLTWLGGSVSVRAPQGAKLLSLRSLAGWHPIRGGA